MRKQYSTTYKDNQYRIKTENKTLHQQIKYLIYPCHLPINNMVFSFQFRALIAYMFIAHSHTAPNYQSFALLSQLLLSNHPHSNTITSYLAISFHSLLQLQLYKVVMMMMGLDRLVVSLKSKIRGLKMKKPYDKIEKSDSMRVEIRSRKARKLIDETMKIADSPERKTYGF